MTYQNPDIESSYRQNDIGRTLYDLVLEKKPRKIVEVGILHGYSTVAMAMALHELGQGHINAYDLFEDYAYKHGTIDIVQDNLKRYGVAEFVTLKKKSLDDWLAAPEEFDLLHVDVSNTSDVIEKVYGSLKDRLAQGAAIIFEGGSAERDQVEWVRKYNKRPIHDAKVPFKVIDARFPSLSMLLSSVS